MWSPKATAPPDTTLPIIRESREGGRVVYAESLWEEPQALDLLGTHLLAVLRQVNFWGTTWSIAAWCETRAGFRVFRFDRIRDPRMMDDEFHEVRGQTFEDFVEMAKQS